MTNLKYLKELIETKSFDTKNNEKIVEYLMKSFGTCSKEIIKINNNLKDKNNLLIGLNCNLKNLNDAIILSGHMDTVIADESSYKTNPYSATIIEDNLFGLGSIDMKSFFATILNNTKELKNLNSPIVIAITSDEETTFNGVALLQNKLRELNIVPKLTIVGEPTKMQICTESKSCYEYKIKITGKSCHSSMPNNGINANYLGARIMLYIEKLCKQFKDTTLSANVISGGDKINIIPQKCEVSFDLRSWGNNNANLLMQKLNKYIRDLEKKYNGCSIEIQNTLAILPTIKKDSDLVKNLITNFDLKESQFVGGCEAGYYQALGGDAIVFGVGDLELAHKPNEYVNILEFEKFNQLLLNILKFADKTN